MKHKRITNIVKKTVKKVLVNQLKNANPNIHFRNFRITPHSISFCFFHPKDKHWCTRFYSSIILIQPNWCPNVLPLTSALDRSIVSTWASCKVTIPKYITNISTIT